MDVTEVDIDVLVAFDQNLPISFGIQFSTKMHTN